MMRPPPAGMLPQRVSCSTPQIWRIASARRGRTGGIGPSGGRTGAASGAIGGAAAAGGGAPPSPIAVTAFLHSGDSAGALTCRQRGWGNRPRHAPANLKLKGTGAPLPRATILRTVAFAPVPSGSRYGLDQVVGTVREGGKGSRLRPRATVPEPLAGSGGAQGLRGRRRATRATGHRYRWAA